MRVDWRGETDAQTDYPRETEHFSSAHSEKSIY